MKLIVPVLILLIACNTSIAQTNGEITFSLQNTIELDLTSDIEIVSRIYNNTLYYLPKKIDLNLKKNSQRDDSLDVVVYTYNLETNKKSKFYFTIPKNEKVHFWSLNSIAINEKYIGLKYDKFYLIDAKTKKIVTSYPVIKGHNYSFASDSLLLITDTYNYHPNDDTARTKIVTCDIRNGNIIKFIQPEFNWPALTHMICQNIDCVGDLLCFSQSLNYDIKFYSLPALELEAHLNLGKIKNNSANITALKKIQDKLFRELQVKDAIYSIVDIDKRLYRIERIYLLNETTLLVSNAFPNCNSNRMLDVWRKTNGEWKQVVSKQLYEIDKTKDGRVIKNDSDIPLFFINTDNNLNVFDNKIALVLSFVYPKVGMKHSDFKTYMDDYFSTHDLNYQLFIYEWKID